jgi:UDP:flavonoid glycosyltransferase YjiC (YdhE family)
MRVLFTHAGGSGHSDPLAPIADAMRSAGHVVAETLGFEMLADTEDPDTPHEIAPLRPLDMAHEYDVLRDFYAGREARARAIRILEHCAATRPDVIVCDEVDFGSMIAAEKLGLPHATVLVTAAGSFVRPEVVAASLDAIRSEHGLLPDPEVAMPGRHLVVSPFPPTFRDPAFPLPPNVHSICAASPHEDQLHSTPPWLPPSSELPLVYLTLGTVFNTESGDLFGRALEALRKLPIELAVTVGRDLDPARFGSQPPHVHIERYVPQSLLLPHCDVVVNHGGSGSVVGALAHGVPMVVLPMGADQALNAARCQELGVGIALDAVRAAPDSIGDAVARVLEAPEYRVAAEGIREEIAALPGPDTVVPLLEALI